MSLTYKEQLTITLIEKAGIGVLLIFVGFWLNRTLEKTKYDLGLDAKRHEIMVQSQIRYKETQLSEFYGPVYALLKHIRPIDNLWNEGRLKKEDKEIIKAIRKSNNRVVEIILTKSHLIRGDTIPDSHTRFLTHVAVWHAFLDDPEADWGDYARLPEAHYDMKFEEEIFRTTEELKSELAALYQQYGVERRDLTFKQRGFE